MSTTIRTVTAKRPPALIAGAASALAAMLVALLPPAPISANDAVPSGILAEDAQAPIPMYLYDFTDDPSDAGSGFDELYGRDPFDDDRILPGELCAYAARGSETAACIDLDPEGVPLPGFVHPAAAQEVLQHPLGRPHPGTSGLHRLPR